MRVAAPNAADLTASARAAMAGGGCCGLSARTYDTAAYALLVIARVGVVCGYVGASVSDGHATTPGAAAVLLFVTLVAGPAYQAFHHVHKSLLALLIRHFDLWFVWGQTLAYSVGAGMEWARSAEDVTDLSPAAQAVTTARASAATFVATVVVRAVFHAATAVCALDTAPALAPAHKLLWLLLLIADNIRLMLGLMYRLTTGASDVLCVVYCTELRSLQLSALLSLTLFYIRFAARLSGTVCCRSNKGAAAAAAVPVPCVLLHAPLYTAFHEPGDAQITAVPVVVVNYTPPQQLLRVDTASGPGSPRGHTAAAQSDPILPRRVRVAAASTDGADGDAPTYSLFVSASDAALYEAAGRAGGRVAIDGAVQTHRVVPLWRIDSLTRVWRTYPRASLLAFVALALVLVVSVFEADWVLAACNVVALLLVTVLFGALCDRTLLWHVVTGFDCWYLMLHLFGGSALVCVALADRVPAATVEIVVSNMAFAAVLLIDALPGLSRRARIVALVLAWAAAVFDIVIVTFPRALPAQYWSSATGNSSAICLWHWCADISSLHVSAQLPYAVYFLRYAITACRTPAASVNRLSVVYRAAHFPAVTSPWSASDAPAPERGPPSSSSTVSGTDSAGDNSPLHSSASDDPRLLRVALLPIAAVDSASSAAASASRA